MYQDDEYIIYIYIYEIILCKVEKFEKKRKNKKKHLEYNISIQQSILHSINSIIMIIYYYYIKKNKSNNDYKLYNEKT